MTIKTIVIIYYPYPATFISIQQLYSWIFILVWPWNGLQKYCHRMLPQSTNFHQYTCILMNGLFSLIWPWNDLQNNCHQMLPLPRNFHQYTKIDELLSSYDLEMTFKNCHQMLPLSTNFHQYTTITESLSTYDLKMIFKAMEMLLLPTYVHQYVWSFRFSSGSVSVCNLENLSVCDDYCYSAIVQPRCCVHLCTMAL